MTQLPTKAEYDVLHERYAERWALETCRSATFIQCLKAFGVAPTITVSTPQPLARSIRISASDIYAARKRFFAGLDSEQDVYCMTIVGDWLVGLYEDWILHDYTDRYRYITSDAQRQWLKRVIILAVARHLMEHKYALFVTRGSQAFADGWVCGEMCRLQLLASLIGELARLAHHIVRDPEQRQALIDQFLADLDIRMRGRLSATPEPLQLLPEGTVLPFALLSQVKETPDG